jgi:hypothetical protein
MAAPSTPEFTSTATLTPDQNHFLEINRHKIQTIVDTFGFVPEEHRLFTDFLLSNPNYLKSTSNPMNRSQSGQRLSSVQSDSVFNESMDRILVQGDEDKLIDLDLLLHSRPWIKSTEHFHAVFSLVKYARMDLDTSLREVSKVMSEYKGDEEELSNQLGRLSYLAEKLHTEIGSVLSKDVPVSFYRYGDILTSFLRYDGSFEDAKVLISEIEDIGKKSESEKALILDAFRFLMTTDNLTETEKKLFVKLVCQEKHWFTVKCLPDFKKMVEVYTGDGFINLEEEARDRFVPEKKEKSQQITDSSEQQKLKRDATFLSHPVDSSEEMCAEHVLEILRKNCHLLENDELRWTREYFCQQTQNESLKHSKRVFSDLLRHYELSELQQRLISHIKSTYPQYKDQIYGWVYGRPWIDSEQQVIELEELLKDNVNLSDAFKILFKAQQLSEGNEEKLRKQLASLTTLRERLLSRTSEIFLKLDTSSEASIQHSRYYINALCAFLSLDCDPDFALMKIGEISKNSKAEGIYEAVSFLMQKAEGKETLSSLVHESWFSVEYFIHLQSMIETGSDFKSAVNRLERLFKKSANTENTTYVSASRESHLEPPAQSSSLHYGDDQTKIIQLKNIPFSDESGCDSKRGEKTRDEQQGRLSINPARIGMDLFSEEQNRVWAAFRCKYNLSLPEVQLIRETLAENTLITKEKKELIMTDAPSFCRYFEQEYLQGDVEKFVISTQPFNAFATYAKGTERQEDLEILSCCPWLTLNHYFTFAKLIEKGKMSFKDAMKNVLIPLQLLFGKKGMEQEFKDHLSQLNLLIENLGEHVSSFLPVPTNMNLVEGFYKNQAQILLKFLRYQFAIDLKDDLHVLFEKIVSSSNPDKLSDDLIFLVGNSEQKSGEKLLHSVCDGSTSVEDLPHLREFVEKGNKIDWALQGDDQHVSKACFS